MVKYFEFKNDIANILTWFGLTDFHTVFSFSNVRNWIPNILNYEAVESHRNNSNDFIHIIIFQLFAVLLMFLYFVVHSNFFIHSNCLSSFKYLNELILVLDRLYNQPCVSVLQNKTMKPLLRPASQQVLIISTNRRSFDGYTHIWDKIKTCHNQSY